MIRISKFDQARGLATIEDVLKLFVAPYLSPGEARLTMDHMQWMKSQTAGMNVDCQLQTFPEGQKTVITLAITFGDATKRILNG